jgi:hypothetical protein
VKVQFEKTEEPLLITIAPPEPENGTKFSKYLCSGFPNEPVVLKVENTMFSITTLTPLKVHP